MNQQKLLCYCTTMFLLLLFSCKGREDYKDNNADMRAVLKLALKTAFFHDNLPGADALLKKKSILITADSVYLKLIPLSYDTINFRIIDRIQVCGLLKKDNTNNNSTYLLISKIEKTSDSLYYVNIQNRSCNTFGGSGSIGVHIAKRGDSLMVREYTSSSIN